MVQVDVLIIGAGPTGMAAALALSQAGKKIMIIDKHEKGLDFSRAIFIKPETLEALKPFGVTDKIIQRGVPVNTFGIADQNGVILNAQVSKIIKNKQGPINLVQIETEECMREALAEHNVIIQRPCYLLDYIQDGSGVTTRVRQLNGTIETIRSEYLLGCDGYHSVTRQLLGLDFLPDKLDKKMIGLDVEMDWKYEEDIIVWILNEGTMISIRLDENKVRFGGIPIEIADRIKTIPGFRKIVWQQEFDIHFACLKKYGRERVWLAGDAAHVHSPVGGRGMNLGIADGLSLAKAVLSGDFKTYEKQRSKINSDWVKQNRMFTKLIAENGFWVRQGKTVVKFVLRVSAKLGWNKIARDVFKQVSGV